MMNILPSRFCLALLLISCLLLPLLAGAHPGGMMRDDGDDDFSGHMGPRGHMYEGGAMQHGAYPGMMMGPMAGNRMGGYMARGFMASLSQLELSDEQRKKIRNIFRDGRKQHLKLMEQMIEATDALADTYEQHATDIKKIGAAYDKVYKVKRNMIMQHLESRNKVMALLTDKQKKKVKEQRPFYGSMMMP